jgi:hypothetical protein
VRPLLGLLADVGMSNLTYRKLPSLGSERRSLLFWIVYCMYSRQSLVRS